jgi:hypothetical protein|tara:strand:+ start:75 stop:341 length:267 start_codon:yes stop_codon:yes gene_type:complete
MEQITKQYLKKLIKEAMEDLGVSHPIADEPRTEHGVVSMEKVDRLKEMKTEIDEMVDMVGPDIDEIAKMSLQELAHEFETTIAALEIR